MIKGDTPFFYPPKAKDNAQKLKEKVYIMKRKIKKSAFEDKRKFCRNSKISRTGNYVSIIVGFVLVIMSFFLQYKTILYFQKGHDVKERGLMNGVTD